EHAPWAPAPEPRVAGVSSFGFGGTNAHVILEEYATTASGSPAPGGDPSPAAPAAVQLLVLSARDLAGLSTLARRYARALQTLREAAFPEVCFTASLGRSEMRERLAVLADDAAEARQSLLAAAHGDATVGSSPTAFTGRCDAGRLARPV